MKKKLSKKRAKQRKESEQRIEQQCGALLKEMNPSEPAPMMGLAAQIEKDMFEPKKDQDVKVDADPKQPEECCMKDFLAVVGALVVAAGIIYGLYSGFKWATDPYVEGNCFSQSEYSNSVTSRIISNDVGVFYEYADTRDEQVGNKKRLDKDFQETYPERIDCSVFFEKRESINMRNQRKDHLKYLDDLMEIYEERIKNANRARKG